MKDAKKQQVILLSVCGSKTYALARDLLQPKKPAETDLKEIVEELEKHYSMLCNMYITAGYKFAAHSYWNVYQPNMVI